MWIGAGVGNTTVSGSSVNLISSLSAGALLLRPFTILRTHLSVLWLSDQQAASEDQIGSLGMIVVTDTAAGVGVTAVPDPSGIAGDPEADWFVWKALMNRVSFASATGVEMNAGRSYDIDSKAMRKVGPDDDVVTVLTNSSGGGAFLRSNGRRLIQLH